MTTLPFRFTFTAPAEESGQWEPKARSPEFSLLGRTFQMIACKWDRQATETHNSCNAFLVWVPPTDHPEPEGPTVRFSLCARSADGSVESLAREALHKFTPSQDDWGFARLSREADAALTKARQDGRLQFVLTIIAISITEEDEISLPAACVHLRRTSAECPHGDVQAGCHMQTQSFFADQRFSDCVVRLTDGSAIPAHRVILSQSSPVFAAMWAGGTQESLQQEASMEAEPAVATALLQSLYCLPFTLKVRQLPDLLALADYYGFTALLTVLLDWLTTSGQLLGPQLLARTIPALLKASASLPPQRVTLHVKSAAPVLQELSLDEHFLSCWTHADVQKLLEACDDENVAMLAVRAASRWVQRDAEHRGQHWAALLQNVDLRSLATSSFAELIADVPGAVLAPCLFPVMLQRLLEAEEQLGGDGRKRQRTAPSNSG